MSSPRRRFDTRSRQGAPDAGLGRVLGRAAHYRRCGAQQGRRDLMVLSARSRFRSTPIFQPGIANVQPLSMRVSGLCPVTPSAWPSWRPAVHDAWQGSYSTRIAHVPLAHGAGWSVGVPGLT